MTLRENIRRALTATISCRWPDKVINRRQERELRMREWLGGLSRKYNRLDSLIIIAKSRGFYSQKSTDFCLLRRLCRELGFNFAKEAGR